MHYIRSILFGNGKKSGSAKLLGFNGKKNHPFDKLDKERISYIRAAENFAGLSPPNGVYEYLLKSRVER